jgi:hypothetical protein
MEDISYMDQYSDEGGSDDGGSEDGQGDMLMAMGFDAEAVASALRDCGGDFEAALTALENKKAVASTEEPPSKKQKCADVATPALMLGAGDVLGHQLRLHTVEGDGDDILRVAKQGAFDTPWGDASKAQDTPLYLLPFWFEEALGELLDRLEKKVQVTGSLASLSAKCAATFLSLMPIVGTFHADDESFTFDPVTSWEREFYHSKTLGNSCFGQDFLASFLEEHQQAGCQDARAPFVEVKMLELLSDNPPQTLGSLESRLRADALATFAVPLQHMDWPALLSEVQNLNSKQKERNAGDARHSSEANTGRDDRIAFVKVESPKNVHIGKLAREMARLACLLFPRRMLLRPQQCMVATYDKVGARYVAHRDNEFVLNDQDVGGNCAAATSGRWLNHRGVTAIVYLENLKPADGGSLRLYTSDQNDESFDVVPVRGSAVFFDARKVLHEVMPLKETTAKRTAISFWLTEVFDVTENENKGHSRSSHAEE